MAAFINKFAGVCSNPTCRIRVEKGAGFITKTPTSWATWCTNCVPERKVAAQPVQSSTPRILTAEGKITLPYEAASVALIKTLRGPNGSNFPKYCAEDKSWLVSTELGDRQRLLEVAQRLQLDVHPSLKQIVLTESAQNAKNAGLYSFQVEGTNWLSHSEVGILADDMGLGKSQPLTAKIMTPNGWITMGEIKVGQKVIGSNGKSCEVIGVFPQGKLPVYKVSFTDGSSTICSDNHLWAVNTSVRNKRGNPHKILPLSEIRTSLKDSVNNNRHFIPMVKPVEIDFQEVPIKPWLMGYIVANGNLTTNTPRITAPCEESAKLVADHLPDDVMMNPVSDNEIDFTLVGTNARFEKNQLTMMLTHFGLMGKGFEQKFVPVNYLFNSVAVRLEVLRGLMDGDGSVTIIDNHVEYSTGSEQLAKDVAFLVQSLGGTANITSRIPSYTYNGEKHKGSLSYRISIAMPKDINPFSLNRKANVYKNREKYQPSRAIVSVELVNEVECQCIAVSAEDHLYVTDDFILTHNTVQAIMALSANAKALVVPPAGLKYNWLAEFKKWRPDFKVAVLNGKESFRFPQQGEIVIANAEILPDWLDPNPPKAPVAKGVGRPVKTKRPKMLWQELKVWREQLLAAHPEAKDVYLIVDEAHRFKNYKAKRSIRIRELSRLCRQQGGRIWALTGTPLDNRVEDLYGMLDSLDMAYEVFSPKKGQTCLKRFQELFNATEGRFGWSYGQPQPQVPELLRRVMLRRRRTDVLPNLPRKTYTNLVVGNLDTSLLRQLDEVWEAEGTALEITQSLPPFEKFSEIRAKIAKNNIPAMLEYIEECEEQNVPLVVFSSHLAPLDELLFRPGWAVISGATSPEKRQEIVDAFQAGRLKGVGITIRAGGVGLTLTRAWKALFVDMDWVPGWNAQAEDRLCRIGQMSNKVEIVRMVNDHPLTLHVLNLLAEKIALIEATVERSMQVVVPEQQANSQNKSETQEEYEARMLRIQQASDELENRRKMESAAEAKARAKSKVETIHNREKLKAKQTLPPLTTERQQAVRDAFKYMLSVCDGAAERDFVGFNKPDAIVAHCLLTAGLETQQEVEAGYYILTRYHRQLSRKYPVLFS